MEKKMTEQAIKEEQEYLTFKLGEEMFALDVSQVREVLDMTNITKVPRSPDFMRGVINVRGSVVPVVDMRLKFGMAQAEKTVHTRIVVMEISLENEEVVLGAMADSVHDVMEIDPAQIEPAPKIGAKWRTEFIKGIGKQEDQFIIILDVDRVFSSEELAMVQAADSEKSDPAQKAAA
jgi:purine-binding chemotaxis protein CheW